MADISRISMGGVEYDIRDKVLEQQVGNREPNGGMGYVILSKDKAFAEQVTKANTIYEIRYDFDLGGQEINIPKNCALQFEGGSLSNGSIVGEQTEIAGVLYHILNNVTLKGRFSNLASNLVWWGATSGEGIDNSTAIQCALDSNIYKIEVSDDYYISSPISLPYNKVIQGRSGYNNKLTGFYANNDFSPKMVDFSSRNGKDAFSQEVRGMFYHRDTTQLELRDIFIDARHKADYCIEHIDLYGGVNLYQCYMKSANQVGMLQYACENPVFNQVLVQDCHIGILISRTRYNAGNPLDSPFYEGEIMGEPNIITGYNVKALECNYGIIIHGCFDFRLADLETSHNSIIGLVAYNTNGEINKYYSEGDARCNFWIREDGVKDVSERGYALPYLIDNKLDGIKTQSTMSKGQEVFVRAAALLHNSSVTLTSAYMSVAPRSYEYSDAPSYELMNNREPQGVDGCFVVKDGGVLSANIIKVYISANGYNRDSLYSVIISIGRYSREKINIENCVGAPIKSLIAPISQLYLNKDYPQNPHSFSCGGLASVDLNWNIEDARRDYSYQKKDERSCKYYGMENNRPLYYYGSALTKAIEFSKEKFESFFDGLRYVKMSVTLKVLKTCTIFPALGVIYADSSYATIYNYLNNVNGASEFQPGVYELVAYVPIQVSFDYKYVSLLCNLTNSQDYVVSHLYLYRVEDGVCSPHNFTSVVLSRGATDKRPVISYEGQEYYDTSLHKMVYANSNLDGWVDSTGTSV